MLRKSTTDSQREGHEDDIITIVRVSLVDDEANVRSAAAQAFDVLQEHIGGRAIDQTIPTLLEALRQPGKGSGTALQALREVMAVSLYIGASDDADFDSGSSHDSLPGLDTNTDCYSHDCLQCPGTGSPCHCCWKCFESEVECDYEHSCSGVGRK